MSRFLDAMKRAGEFPATLVATTVGVLYAVGFAVINVLLANFGVSDFSSFDVRFVLTGLLFAGYVALPVIPIIVAIRFARLLRKSAPLVARAGLVVIVAVVTFYSVGVLAEYVIDDASYPATAPLWLYTVPGWRLYVLDDHNTFSWAAILRMVPVGLCGSILLRGGRPVRGRPGLNPALLFVAWGVLITALWMLLTNFSFETFRHLRAGYGGGAYGKRSFVLSKPEAKALRALRLPLVGGTMLQDAAVLYESKDSLIFLPPSTCVECWQTRQYSSFQIAKSGVEAVRWFSQ